MAREPRSLVIALGDLRYVDSCALHVLLRATRPMDRHGLEALARPQEPVAWVLRLTAAG